MYKRSDWRDFEIAVTAFLRAIAPDAKVTHDVVLPDIHTGKPRQRDIWVETTILNHLPLKILVSCKRKSRSLSQSDIDAFIGELGSSGASKGILYSHRGYTRPAIEKAKKLNISCCKLYQNQPPEIPDLLLIPNCYSSYPEAQVVLLDKIEEKGKLRTWNDILDLVAEKKDDRVRKVIDVIVDKFMTNEIEAIEKTKKDRVGFPYAWNNEIVITTEDKNHYCIRLLLVESWRDYVADIEGFLINGSYSFSDKVFVGNQYTPSIDTWGIQPGKGWRELITIPSNANNSIRYPLKKTG